MSQTPWRESRQAQQFGKSGLLTAEHAGHPRPATLPAMTRIFAELWKLTDRYIQTMHPFDDAPWFGNEVSLCGLLTAAAYQAGFVSLPEFSTSRSHGGKGRGDWWFMVDGCEVYAETKALSSGPGSDWPTSALRAAQDRLRETLWTPTVECRWLAMCFCRLYYAGNRNDPSNAWADWIGPNSVAADPSKISYIAYYILDRDRSPFNDGGFPRRPDGWYPGLVIACKEF